VIIGCGFGMHYLAFLVGIMILMFSIGALLYGIYLQAMQMEWVFGFLEIGMNNIICLLMGFILMELFRAKSTKSRRPKRKQLLCFP
jgi:hypothetical protein